jgi:hypothetical protein
MVLTFADSDVATDSRAFAMDTNSVYQLDTIKRTILNSTSMSTFGTFDPTASPRNMHIAYQNKGSSAYNKLWVYFPSSGSAGYAEDGGNLVCFEVADNLSVISRYPVNSTSRACRGIVSYNGSMYALFSETPSIILQLVRFDYVYAGGSLAGLAETMMFGGESAMGQDTHDLAIDKMNGVVYMSYSNRVTRLELSTLSHETRSGTAFRMTAHDGMLTLSDYLDNVYVYDWANNVKVGPGNSSVFDVAWINGSVWMSSSVAGNNNIILYNVTIGASAFPPFPDPACPGDGACSGMGSCVNGVCKCNPGHYGADCSGCQKPPYEGCFSSMTWPFCDPDESDGVFECSNAITGVESIACCLSERDQPCPDGWSPTGHCTSNYNTFEPDVIRFKCTRDCPEPPR